jgi:hypothetical protein
MFYPILLVLLAIIPTFSQTNTPSAPINQQNIYYTFTKNEAGKCIYQVYHTTNQRAQQKPYHAVGAATSGSIALYLLADTISNAKNVNQNQPGKNASIGAESLLTLAFGLTAAYFFNELTKEADKENKGN